MAKKIKSQLDVVNMTVTIQGQVFSLSECQEGIQKHLSLYGLHVVLTRETAASKDCPLNESEALAKIKARFEGFKKGEWKKTRERNSKDMVKISKETLNSRVWSLQELEAIKALNIPALMTLEMVLKLVELQTAAAVAQAEMNSKSAKVGRKK